jgi:hypothetical protein
MSYITPVCITCLTRSRRPRTHRRNNLVDNEWVAQKCADGGTFVSGRQKISIGGFFGTPSTNHRFGDVNRPRGGGGRVAARDSQKSFENSAIIGRCHLLRIKIQKCANFSKLFGARHAPTSPLVETSLVRADRLARLSTTQHSSFIHREQLAQCAPVCLARLTFIHRSKKKKALFFEQGKKTRIMSRVPTGGHKRPLVFFLKKKKKKRRRCCFSDGL